MAIDLAEHIRNVPDFPIHGVQFKDITSLLLAPDAFNETINRMVELAAPANADCLAAVDSRGFIFAAPMALRMSVPMVLLRKAGKLPGATSVLRVHPGIWAGRLEKYTRTTCRREPVSSSSTT